MAAAGKGLLSRHEDHEREDRKQHEMNEAWQDAGAAAAESDEAEDGAPIDKATVSREPATPLARSTTATSATNNSTTLSRS